MAKATAEKLAPASADILNLRAKPPKEASFSDISKALFDAGEIVPASEFGTGFDVLGKEEKGRLVGVPFIILDWQMNEGDFGPFASLQIITQAGERLVVNDGSTGIAKQMAEIAEAGEQRAIYVKHGLRRSDYEYTDPKDGTKKPASTFYLDTSA